MKIDLRTIPDAEVSGIDLMDVDITLPAPEAEPQAPVLLYGALKTAARPGTREKKRQRIPDCLYHNIRMSDECPRF